MHPRYYLHGDLENGSEGAYFCRMCDLFVQRDHFENPEHQAALDRMIWDGLTYLSDAEKSLRPESWPNLFDRKLLLVRHKFNEEQARLKRRRPISPSTRFKVLKHYDSRCQLCGRTPADGIILHIDHRIALVNGGTNDLDNLWPLCADCNLGKGASDL